MLTPQNGQTHSNNSSAIMGLALKGIMTKGMPTRATRAFSFLLKALSFKKYFYLWPNFLHIHTFQLSNLPLPFTPNFVFHLHFFVSFGFCISNSFAKIFMNLSSPLFTPFYPILELTLSWTGKVILTLPVPIPK